MTTWPPDELCRSTAGPNDADARPDEGGMGLDSDRAGRHDDRVAIGGDGAGFPHDGDRSLGDGGGFHERAAGSPGNGGGFSGDVRSGIALEKITRIDSDGDPTRLVPASVGRFLPVSGALGPHPLVSPSLVPRSLAPPRLAAIPAVTRTAASIVEAAGAATAETTVDHLDARSIAALPGAGPLTAFLVDPAVTDVLVNGVDVWIDRGAGLVRCDFTFSSDTQVRRLAQRLAAACGRRLDEGSPYVDARLPDGTRLHAVLPPIATDGPYLSLRTFREHAFSLNDLVGLDTLSESGAEMLGAIVAARLSYLVSGGTGSGKTTLLATLLSEVPPNERIVIVEDATELRPRHPHVVGLQARTANVEGAGAIGLRDLLRQALRMRPDRLVVGECRGAEVVDLLGALNTGHEGGAGTLHANTAADVPARLEALGLLSGVPRAALHAQVAAALHVVVHMRRMPTGRKLDEIVLLAPSRDGRAVVSVSAWHRLGGVRPGAVPLANLMTSRGVRPPTALLAGRP
ncbi:MAG TPA: TadA family conjugal transfer-associated ATPase [Micromonosporaceae bacterium]|nr:TadA family conjugal transfer-associated ATPase [Micromonosporaceae bacterium]